MGSTRSASLALGLAAAFWACGGGQSDQQTQQSRDLSLAPAESTARLSDQPAAQPPAAQPTAQPTTPAAQPKAAPPKPAAPAMLATGTTIDLMASDSLNSRHNKKGDAVTATSASAIKSKDGRQVIPLGAVFQGTISDIAPAEHPGGQGRLVLTFTRVSFGGKSYGVQASVDTIGTTMKGRGVTAGDAAKVGAGAVVGGIAGRLIGGNKTGTAVGAAAGAAAGVGVAAATRDIDIILPAGALIRIVLTAPFELKPIVS